MMMRCVVDRPTMLSVNPICRKVNRSEHLLSSAYPYGAEAQVCIEVEVLVKMDFIPKTWRSLPNYLRERKREVPHMAPKALHRQHGKENRLRRLVSGEIDGGQDDRRGVRRQGRDGSTPSRSCPRYEGRTQGVLDPCTRRDQATQLMLQGPKKAPLPSPRFFEMIQIRPRSEEDQVKRMDSMQTSKSLKEYLEQLHVDGVIDIDQPLRAFLSDRGLHVDIANTESEEARSCIVVWPTFCGDDELVPLETLTGSIDELRSMLETLRAELHVAIGESRLK
jgi:hypothetical protein